MPSRAAGMNRMLPTALVGVAGLVLAYWYASRGPRRFPVEYLRRRDAALPMRLPGEPSGIFHGHGQSSPQALDGSAVVALAGDRRHA